MSRTLLILLAALALAAAPALAQSGSPSIAIDGLPATTTVGANLTSQSLPFQVTLMLPTGSCLGGSGVFTVALSAEQTGAGNMTADVTVNPATLTFNAGTLPTATGAYSATSSSTLIVSPGIVTQPTNITVAVKGTLSGNCPAGDASSETQAQTSLRFTPVTALTATNTEDPVPGFELPLMVLGIVALAIVLRRKA